MEEISNLENIFYLTTESGELIDSLHQSCYFKIANYQFRETII